MILTRSTRITAMVVVFLPVINSIRNAETSDFAEVMKSEYFVDKTLLIKDFFYELYKIKNLTKLRYVKVLTQRQFGKSTNLDMMKKFLEISVDGNGSLFEENNTDLCLFSKPGLQIFKEKEFLVKHFGAYPVISIDLKPVSEVKSFGDLINILRKIIKKTFGEHKYLLNSTRLWSQHFNKNQFAVFFEKGKIEKLHEYTLYCSFSILSNILYNNFKRRVVVLIDNFDSFQESLAYKDPSLKREKKKITTFMGIIYSDLLLANKHLFGALLSGSSHLGKLYLTKVSQSEKPYSDITDLSENCSNTLWKYYGLSREELILLVRRIAHDPEQAREAEENISQVNTNNVTSCNPAQPYSIWSVINYFRSK